MCSSDNIVELGGLVLHENSIQVISDSVAGNVMRPSRLGFRTESSTNSVHHLQKIFAACQIEQVYTAATLVSTGLKASLCTADLC